MLTLVWFAIPFNTLSESLASSRFIRRFGSLISWPGTTSISTMKNHSIHDTWRATNLYFRVCQCELTFFEGLREADLLFLGIAALLTTTTLCLILCHRRLRKCHHVFPFNIVLADFLGVYVSILYEILMHVGMPMSEVIQVYYFIVYACILESILSILMVSIYQFITIKLDPFHTRHIVTTPRCICACALTWVMTLGISSFNLLDIRPAIIINISVCLTAVTITGLSYVFIYRAVAKLPCQGSIPLQQRKEENRRILRTMGLVYGTSLLCWACPWVEWILWSFGVYSACLIQVTWLMITVNWITNSAIYWWRLKQFRAILPLCMQDKDRVISLQPSL